MFYAAPAFTAVKTSQFAKRNPALIAKALAGGYCAGWGLADRIRDQIAKGDYQDWRWMRDYMEAFLGRAR
jgi:hypothetical protein